MASKPKPDPKDRPTDAERVETHMELFERLARVKNMHGAPGPKKPRKG